MSAGFEYTVVELKGPGKTWERDQTELLNRVAEHGWRLVAITGEKPYTYAYFERPAGGDRG